MISCFGASLLLAFSVVFLEPIHSNPDLRDVPGLRAFFVGFGLFIFGCLGAVITVVSYVSILFICQEPIDKHRKLKKAAEWFLVFLGIMFVPMLFVFFASFIFQY